MGWGHFVHSAKEVLTNPKNIAAAVAAPFTAGASLAMMEDNSGRSVIDGLRGTSDIEKQNQFNADQAKLTRDWQENLANTAIQRSTADAMAAGYNPVLGATNPAATPTGATATSAGLPQSPISAISEAVSAGSNLMNTIADVGLKSEQSGLTKAETKKLVDETRWLPRLSQAKIELDNATSALQRAQIATEQGKAMALDFDNKMKSMNIEKRSKQWEKELEIYKEQMTQALVDAGYDNTSIGTFIRGLGKGVHQLSPFSEFIGHSDNKYTYTNVNY